MPHPPPPPQPPPRPAPVPTGPRYPDPTPPGAPKKKYKTGAKPTPREVIRRAPHFHPRVATPENSGFFPSTLRMWGNDQYGDCVSAEEACCKACWTPEIDLSDATVIAWAQANGYLDGANLTEVMDSMAQQGMSDGQTTWGDGPYATVDYTSPAELCAAIAIAPVKLGIMSSALPSGAGNQQGWYALSPGPTGPEDHCVGLTAQATASWWYAQMGLPLPAGVPGDTRGYGLFTWSTMGFVTDAWIQAATSEAWLRDPATVAQSPAPTPTPPQPAGLCAALAALAERWANRPLLLSLVRAIQLAEGCATVGPSGLVMAQIGPDSADPGAPRRR